MTIFQDDTNKQPDPNMTKLQEQARVSVSDGTPKLNPFEPMTIDISDKLSHKGVDTNEGKPLDPATNPAQGFVKHPTKL